MTAKEIKERALQRARDARENPRQRKINKRNTSNRKTSKGKSPKKKIKGSRGEKGEDMYGITSQGGSDYGIGSGASVCLYFNEGEYTENYDIIGIHQSPEIRTGKYVRTAKFDISFHCEKDDGSKAETQGKSALIYVSVIIQDVYSSRNIAKNMGSITHWFKNKYKEAGRIIADNECQSWNSSFCGCDIDYHIDDTIPKQYFI